MNRTNLLRRILASLILLLGTVVIGALSIIVATKINFPRTLTMILIEAITFLVAYCTIWHKNWPLEKYT